ncbi:hypothetical protein Hte_005490 [Hypoxylon texense]
MSDFEVFGFLPTELRLTIWDLACRREAEEDRLHMVGRSVRSLDSPMHLLPLEHHISPLLAVSKESRSCALKFYYVKLDIYEAPTAIVRDSSKFDLAVSHLEKEKRDHRTIREVKRVGVVYLNPQCDFFLQGKNIALDLNRPINLSQPTLPAHHRPDTPSRCLTARVSPELARTFQNVVLVERSEFPDFRSVPARADVWWYDSQDWVTYVHGVSTLHPHFCAPDKAKYAWNTRVFRGIQNFWHLYVSEAELGNFVHKVNEMGGRGSLDIRRWVPYMDADDEKRPHVGGWVLFDSGELRRQGRDMRRIGDDLKALWAKAAEAERQLMALGL